MCSLDEKIIFVLNCGRSGSKSFSQKFGLEHEPDKGIVYINKIKDRARMHLMCNEYYGETSHFLKNYIEELKKEFPNATYIHLMRNGRDVVKSFIKRGMFVSTLDGYPLKNENIPIKNWSKLSIFEKICWYWKFWNEKLRKNSTSTIRLEDISWFLPCANKDNRKVNWTPEHEKVFWEICGALMKKYNYI